MHEPTLDDARSSDPVERLLEDSWQTRSRRMGGWELIVETAAALLFLGCAVPLAGGLRLPSRRPAARSRARWHVRARLAHDQVPDRRRICRALVSGARPHAAAAAWDRAPVDSRRAHARHARPGRRAARGHRAGAVLDPRRMAHAGPSVGPAARATPARRPDADARLHRRLPRRLADRPRLRD